MFHGKYMYLAGGKGLKIFDAQTDVFQPVPVGEIIDTGALSRKGGVALQIVDNYLYVAGGGGARSPLAGRPGSAGPPIPYGSHLHGVS